jgi:gluconolactonase
MTNGGTGPYNGSLLLITSGRGDRPPSIVLVNPKPPYNATVLLNNFFGRQFNSLNDIKVHPTGKIFFTDVTYVWFSGYDIPSLMKRAYEFAVTAQFWAFGHLPPCQTKSIGLIL